MMLNQLKKKTRLYEDIVKQFMQKIEAGELKAGDKLPTERELVEQLGVSRSSVREALRAMELLGVVQSKVGGGTFIKHSRVDRNLLQFSDSRADEKIPLLETLEVRVVLEAYSAAQAAKKRSDGQLAELRGVIEEMRRDIGEGNRGSGADIRFHLVIAEMAGNGTLVNLLSTIAETLSSSIAMSNAHVDSRDILAEHVEMCEAIARRDDRVAERLMRAHLKRAHKRVSFLFAEGEGR